MDAKKFGLFLQAVRKERGLTQGQLAEKLHVTDKAVSRWERGLGFPDISTLQPLADALEVSLSELMQGERKAEVTIKEADQVVANALDVAKKQNSRLKKRVLRFVLIPLACILLLVAAYLIGTGLGHKNSMGLVDYAQLRRGDALLIRPGDASSIGYVRSCSDISDNGEEMIIRFHTAFGGLNSNWGAKNAFLLTPDSACTAIYFERYDEAHKLVLVRDAESGLWEEPEK